MGFPEMIASVPCMSGQNATEVPKTIINITREESAQVAWSQPQYTAMKSSGPCHLRSSLWAFASSGDLLDKHSCTSLKLGGRATRGRPVDSESACYLFHPH